MGQHSYEKGATAGRKGSDPCPPKHNLLDSISGVSEEKVDGWARDYQQGYQAGSHQRVADETKRARDK